MKILILFLCAVAACAVEPVSTTSSASEVTEMLSDRTQAAAVGSIDIDETCPVGPRGTCGTGGTPTSCLTDGSTMCCTTISPGNHICCTIVLGESTAQCYPVNDVDFCTTYPLLCNEW